MDKRKLFAIAAIGILLLAGAGFIVERAASNLRSQSGPAGRSFPIPPDNVAVADGPKAEAETTMAISPTDHETIVAGANDFNTRNGDKWDGFYTTHDLGKSWKRSFIDGYIGGPVSPLTGFDASSDPVIAVDSSGNFYYAGLAFKRHVNLPAALANFYVGRGDCMFVAKSTDRGDTFGKITIVSTAIEWRIKTDDKEWLAADPVNGNLYLVWVVYSGSNTARVLFSRSTDGDQSWSKPATISGIGSGMSFVNTPVAVDNNGVVHIAWTDGASNQNYYMRSTDQGSSFSPPVVVAPVSEVPNPLPHGDFRTGSGVVLAVDTSEANTSGALYIAWEDYASGDSDILLSASHDGGTSWESPVRVNNDPVGNGADQFFPAVAVSSEGWVHVGFYDRRADPNDTLMEYWWAISFDGGRTFPINIPMSNASFNGAYSPPYESNSNFMGDYTAIAADNETVAATWCDTRNGSASSGNSDIYGAMVPYKELLRTNKFANVRIPWPAESKG